MVISARPGHGRTLAHAPGDCPKMSDSKSLPGNQALAIQSLLSGQTKSQAATAAGVNPRTLTRWLNDETFTAELNWQKSVDVGVATARLIGSMDTAVTTILEIMNGSGGNAHKRGNQLRAAKIALDSALKLIEINDVLQRLAALEGRL